MFLNDSYVFMAAFGAMPHHRQPLVLLLIGIGLLWLFASQFLDLVKRQFPEPNLKIVWAIALIFLPCLGALLYLLVGRNQGTLE